MTNLQERLFKLRTYNIKFEMSDEHIVMRIDYPESWEALAPSNQDIKIFRDKENENRYYYQAPISYDIGCVIDEIDQVIKINREAELKLSLFNNKIEELHQIFLDEPYEKLRLIQFTFPEPLQNIASAKTKQKPRKKKTISSVKSEPRNVIDEKANITQLEETPNEETEEIVIEQHLDGPSAADDIVNQYI